jgi:uncharacterized protein (DUF305 family)
MLCGNAGRRRNRRHGLDALAFGRQQQAGAVIAKRSGAIGMAKTEIADGKNPEMIALARNIVTAQQAEIDQMTAMSSGSGG